MRKMDSWSASPLAKRSVALMIHSSYEGPRDPAGEHAGHGRPMTHFTAGCGAWVACPGAFRQEARVVRPHHAQTLGDQSDRQGWAERSNLRDSNSLILLT